MNTPHLKEFVRSVLQEQAKTEYARVALPFKKTDLAPVKSEETIDYHYGTLYKGYVEKANAGVGGAFQIAGAFLHGIYFSQFKPPAGTNRPTGPFLALVEKRYGDYDKFRDQVKEVAMKIQGSGWVYMDTKGAIKTIVNHETRPDICLLIDWWEHAWALDYQADKEKYLDNIWKIIDWEKINARLVTEE
jgi:Fe-Mn family superoxide dismutase